MTNMILLQWKEYGAQDAPSMRESFEPMRYDGMEKIVDCLTHKGKVHLAANAVDSDFFTGKRISLGMQILDDGEYSWCSSLAYYVQNYNLRLPKEFKEKVLKQ